VNPIGQCAPHPARLRARGPWQGRSGPSLAFTIWFLFASTLLGFSQETGLTLLTNAQQIVALSNHIPAGQYQIKFEGRVIFVAPASRRLYVQEGDLGVQVNARENVANFRPGQRVAINGTVLGGEPTLRISDGSVSLLGDGELPEPKRVSIHQLITGRDAFRHVQVRGMVRDMYATANELVLQLTQDGFPFEVRVSPTSAPLPVAWTDAEIEVTGFSYPYYNNNGRVTSIRFHAGSTNDVTVLEPGIGQRFEGRPLLTLAEASRLTNSLKARYRVSGTVTACRPGIAYFITDGTGVMLVDTTLAFLRPPADARRLDREPQIPLEPGDRVEVIGARHNWFSLTPSLMATEYRRMGRGEVPAPMEVTFRELLEGRHSGRLVTLRAQLMDQRRWGSSNLRQHLALVLRVDGDIFQAIWDSEHPAKWNLPIDGYVRITGVNDAEGSTNRKRSTFKLILRSPADVVPVPAPPFWTRQEIQRIGLAAGVVALLAGAWILFQRTQMRHLEQRVTARTADLRGANEQLQREVLQRRAAEENLRSSEARKAAVLESALDSIITIDQHGRITDFNPAAEKAFGYGRSEVLGREMAELIIPPPWRERHRAGLRKAVEKGVDTMVGRRVEVVGMRRTGEEFPVELALSRISTDEGPLFTAHIQDISERKRAEIERERALAHEKELSELKSRFVSMVSHEFRTPLGIIASSAEILEAYLDRLSPKDRLANLRDITDATRQMSRMMEEVLLLGRVEAGKMTCRPALMNLAVFGRRLADEVLSATNARCPIEFTTVGAVDEARADDGLLRHIFTNLLNNASKYSAPGSPVEFRVEAQPPLAIFTIRDRGIGIPETDARALFQAFHRGRNVGDTPGTGLGMTIVKRCVELHGGRIGFETREGQGTTFVVALPVLGNNSTAAGNENTAQILRATNAGRNFTLVP
jgi:PAS domain S-box-containing protein